MSRRALIRKRCSSCGATIPDKVCPKGHRRWTWSFTVDVNPSGAPRKQLTRSGYSTKVEAQRALDEFKVASSRGEYVEPSRLTVGAYIDELVDSGCPGQAPTLDLRVLQEESTTSRASCHWRPAPPVITTD